MIFERRNNGGHAEIMWLKFQNFPPVEYFVGFTVDLEFLLLDGNGLKMLKFFTRKISVLPIK